ncbi:hypothetical protein H310_11604 [Aphanomyces invadans]|uniref:Late endosomal/lysosomal adaptor and MAPK and MTOR activator 4 n=1 Tax=Aphanomyces invadans TaxID=157072 RepID=A0A024TMX6_9STRA|nr:hypothetical protein H310_11604 [Aphanomyces invadans]ETV94961.1 hypothetical protein H310_11604 [Aphanomyces invadans]|eukprot:XP_008876552.1 hypothetical protein H310_11604 [Aphanomyces invadans]
MEAVLNLPHQVGTIVLDTTGKVVSSSGELAGDDSIPMVVQNLLLDCGDLRFLKGRRRNDDEDNVNDDEALERLTISFPGYQFIVAFDTEHTYVVKQSVDSDADSDSGRPGRP